MLPGHVRQSVDSSGVIPSHICTARGRLAYAVSIRLSARVGYGIEIAARGDLRAVGAALRASSRVTLHMRTAVHTASCELVKTTTFHGSASRGTKRTVLKFHGAPEIVTVCGSIRLV